MRKLFSIVLALSLALSLSVPALAASGDVTYLAYNAATGEFDTETKAEGEYTEVTSSTTIWRAGWYVVSADVEISSRITVSGDVHLILVDGYTLNAKKGITVNSDRSLTIYGQADGTGTLTTGTPAQYYAGIGGGGMNQSSGAITINGGVVTAKGGNYGAGIGGGNKGTGTVTINGGVVTGTGGSNGAGIGNGYGGSATSSVTINGGVVTGTGGTNAAGIGGGGTGTGAVTINGGVVTAKGGSYGAGIGSGYNRSGTVTINGGTVTSTGGTNAAGIGGGYSGTDASTVTISGGFVTATGGGSYGAAIGRGSLHGYDNGTESGTFSDCVVLKKSGWAATMTGAIYGSPTLTTDATVPSGITLTIPANSTLTIDGDATLTNNGTITVEDTLQNDGTLMNNGTIHGAVTGSGRIIVDGNIVIKENYENKTGAASLAHEVAPAYTVTIPASVTIDGTATVSASGVRVDYGKQVVVRLSHINENGTDFTVALAGDENETLAYTVSASGNVSNASITRGDTVLTVNPNTAADGSTTLTFKLADDAEVKYSGTYSGTVTFTVSVE